MSDLKNLLRRFCAYIETKEDTRMMSAMTDGKRLYCDCLEAICKIQEAEEPAPHPPEEPSSAPAGDWEQVHALAAQAADELMRHDARSLVVMIRDIAAQHLPEPSSAPAFADRLMAVGYAPGGYSILCQRCRKMSNGCDKRAITCHPCAVAMVNAPAPASRWSKDNPCPWCKSCGQPTKYHKPGMYASGSDGKPCTEFVPWEYPEPQAPAPASPAGRKWKLTTYFSTRNLQVMQGPAFAECEEVWVQEVADPEAGAPGTQGAT